MNSLWWWVLQVENAEEKPEQKHVKNKKVLHSNHGGMPPAFLKKETRVMLHRLRKSYAQKDSGKCLSIRKVSSKPVCTFWETYFWILFMGVDHHDHGWEKCAKTTHMRSFFLYSLGIKHRNGPNKTQTFQLATLFRGFQAGWKFIVQQLLSRYHRKLWNYPTLHHCAVLHLSRFTSVASNNHFHQLCSMRYLLQLDDRILDRHQVLSIYSWDAGMHKPL